VVDKSGAPIGDAQVIAEPDWSGGTTDRARWAVRGVQEIVTDQAGAFRFAGLPDESYRIRAARPGASEAALALSTGVETLRRGAIKITVPADGRVVGKVQLTTARHLSVHARSARQPQAVRDHDGAFAMPAAAGTYPLAITGPASSRRAATSRSPRVRTPTSVRSRSRPAARFRSRARRARHTGRRPKVRRRAAHRRWQRAQIPVESIRAGH
jgi:hypothetical protein